MTTQTVIANDLFALIQTHRIWEGENEFTHLNMRHDGKILLSNGFLDEDGDANDDADGMPILARVVNEDDNLEVRLELRQP